METFYKDSIVWCRNRTETRSRSNSVIEIENFSRSRFSYDTTSPVSSLESYLNKTTPLRTELADILANGLDIVRMSVGSRSRQDATPFVPDSGCINEGDLISWRCLISIRLYRTESAGESSEGSKPAF